MSATSEIQAKWEALKAKGLNLGSPIGDQADAGFGGQVQVYQYGRIYWHRDTGAQEVHGGILTKYLAAGGPGVHPQTGRRHFGFPVTDEERTSDDLFPISRFQFGEIDWVSGTGGVAIYGDFYQEWKALGKEIGKLQHPVCEPVALADGLAVYFERGCMWQGPASGDKVIVCTIDLPQLGRPRLINPTDRFERRFPRLATWQGLPQEVLQSILLTKPRLFRDLWVNRMALRTIKQPNLPLEEIVLQAEPMELGSENPDTATVYVTLTVPEEPVPLRDRTLYNFGLRLPNGLTFTLSPHAVYTKRAWSEFGLIHATDLHVSRRLESFRGRLRQLAAQNSQLAPGVEAYTNFNDNFRDLIRYANHLHDIGMLDGIMATGDLVDYGFEQGERSGYKGGNYAFFEKLMRGQVASPDGVLSEELRVPIFTTLGNHDYRVNPYALRFSVDIPLKADPVVNHYGSHNLTAGEAEALQGGRPKYSIEQSLEMVQIDILNQRREYEYYLRRINHSGSYVVELGPHRLAMLDTRFDDWVPPTTYSGDMDLLILYLTGNVSAAANQAKDGSAPNSKGLGVDEINLLQQGLSNAGSDGLVIVGMHAPPFNLQRNEFPHYFRQTERPRANRREMYGYLMRNMSSFQLWGLAQAISPVLAPEYVIQANLARITQTINGISDNQLTDAEWDQIMTRINGYSQYADWLYHGGDYFKVNGIDGLLDDGIALDQTKSLLPKFVGVGSARPADLVLCGHHHDRVGYRLWWDSTKNRLQIYTDFYTENPAAYYPSTKVGVKGPVAIRVREGAATNGAPALVRDHRFTPALEYYRLDVPPYVQPLNAAANPRAWWQGHRPLIMETAALGPIDRNQRMEDERAPAPSFQGFRLISVADNVIKKMHYVTLRELRQNNFRMPWESSVLVTPVESGPVVMANISTFSEELSHEEDLVAQVVQ